MHPCGRLVPWMNKSSYEQELREHGTLTYTTVGRSMRPFLRSGEDLMVIRANEGFRFQKYDAVLYRRKSGKYVLHRIVKVRESDYVLSGDNIWMLEKGIRDDQILGVLTTVIRNGKLQDVNEPAYKRKVKLWWMIYPLRFLPLWGRDQFHRTAKWLKSKRG